MFKCPLCIREFSWAAKLEKHIQVDHGSDPETTYVRLIMNGITPMCGCNCGGFIPWNGWKLGFSSKFLRGHNASVSNSFSVPELHKKAQATRVANIMSGKTRVWNDGLTKDTDERLATAAKKKSITLKEGYASGKYVAPWTGKTKETCESLARSSMTKKRNLASGKTRIWTKGLTKETDERLRVTSEKIAKTKRENKDAHRRAGTQRILDAIDKAGFNLLSDVSEYRQRRVKRMTVSCKACGTQQEKSLAMIEESPVCFVCHPKDSLGQLDVASFVTSLGFEIRLSDDTIISPRDIDVYVPVVKFGIEYNGLYYHSEKFKKKRFHENKTIDARMAGIRLFHIFDDEWINKRSIIESMLRSRLGIITNRFHARKLAVKQISSKERRDFFIKSHIDGNCRAKMSWGLFAGIELIAALSLKKPKQPKYADSYEIARFACQLNSCVVGGLGKLLAVAKEWAKNNGAKRLITYVDNRHGDGHGYERVGFIQIGTTVLRFWWTDTKNRFARENVMANKQKGLTQKEAGAKAGFMRVFGCSNKIYELNL